MSRNLNTTQITTESGKVRLSDLLLANASAQQASQIRLNFKNIRDVDEVPEVYREQCERLLLAQNNIVELKGFRQFTNLQQLSLSYNMIKDLGQLQHLRPLSESLHALSLDGNMIADHPAYRHCCLALLPRLRTLDSKPVTFNERQDVKDAMSVSAELLSFMFAQHRSIALLHQSVDFLRIKLELYQRAYGSHAIFRFFEPPNEAAIVRRELAVPSLLEEFECKDCDKETVRPKDLLVFMHQSLKLPLLLRAPAKAATHDQSDKKSAFFALFSELALAYEQRRAVPQPTSAAPVRSSWPSKPQVAQPVVSKLSTPMLLAQLRSTQEAALHDLFAKTAATKSVTPSAVNSPQSSAVSEPELDIDDYVFQTLGLAHLLPPASTENASAAPAAAPTTADVRTSSNGPVARLRSASVDHSANKGTQLSLRRSNSDKVAPAAPAAESPSSVAAPLLWNEAAAEARELAAFAAKVQRKVRAKYSASNVLHAKLDWQWEAELALDDLSRDGTEEATSALPLSVRRVAVYGTDAAYLKTIYQMLMQQRRQISALEQQRADLLQVSHFALNVPMLAQPHEREVPVEAWRAAGEKITPKEESDLHATAHRAEVTRALAQTANEALAIAISAPESMRKTHPHLFQNMQRLRDDEQGFNAYQYQTLHRAVTSPARISKILPDNVADELKMNSKFTEASKEAPNSEMTRSAAIESVKIAKDGDSAFHRVQIVQPTQARSSSAKRSTTPKTVSSANSAISTNSVAATSATKLSDLYSSAGSRSKSPASSALRESTSTRAVSPHRASCVACASKVGSAETAKVADSIKHHLDQSTVSLRGSVSRTKSPPHKENTSMPSSTAEKAKSVTMKPSAAAKMEVEAVVAETKASSPRSDMQASLAENLARLLSAASNGSAVDSAQIKAAAGLLLKHLAPHVPAMASSDASRETTDLTRSIDTATAIQAAESVKEAPAIKQQPRASPVEPIRASSPTSTSPPSYAEHTVSSALRVSSPAALMDESTQNISPRRSPSTVVRSSASSPTHASSPRSSASSPPRMSPRSKTPVQTVAAASGKSQRHVYPPPPHSHSHAGSLQRIDWITNCVRRAVLRGIWLRWKQNRLQSQKQYRDRSAAFIEWARAAIASKSSRRQNLQRAMNTWRTFTAAKQQQDKLEQTAKQFRCRTVLKHWRAQLNQIRERVREADRLRFQQQAGQVLNQWHQLHQDKAASKFNSEQADARVRQTQALQSKYEQDNAVTETNDRLSALKERAAAFAARHPPLTPTKVMVGKLKSPLTVKPVMTSPKAGAKPVTVRVPLSPRSLVMARAQSTYSEPAAIKLDSAPQEPPQSRVNIPAEVTSPTTKALMSTLSLLRSENIAPMNDISLTPAAEPSVPSASVEKPGEINRSTYEWLHKTIEAKPAPLVSGPEQYPLPASPKGAESKRIKKVKSKASSAASSPTSSNWKPEALQYLESASLPESLKHALADDVNLASQLAALLPKLVQKQQISAQKQSAAETARPRSAPKNGGTQVVSKSLAAAYGIEAATLKPRPSTASTPAKKKKAVKDSSKGSTKKKATTPSRHSHTHHLMHHYECSDDSDSDYDPRDELKSYQRDTKSSLIRCGIEPPARAKSTGKTKKKASK